MGGQGSVLGVLLGASIMGVLRNGLVLMEVSSYWQELIIGLVISMFTAVFVSHTIFELEYGRRSHIDTISI